MYFENDLFSNTDEGYTNGFKVSWVSPDLHDYLEDPTLPRWIREINDRLTFFHEARTGLQRNLTFSVGQTLFTPQDLTRGEVIEDDRPYAGWLFASIGYQTRRDNQLDTLEASLGVVGPAALGEATQNLFHELRDIDRFQGWDNQLANEPGLLFLWEHQRKLEYEYHENSRFGFDVIGHAGIALGNVASYINAGAEVRIGWAIPDDFGTAAVRPGGDNSTPDASWDPRSRSGKKWGAHAFLSFDTRLVGRNIFLDGNTFRDSHRVDKKQTVTDAAIGVSLIYGGVKISYAQIFRSKEFAQQDHSNAYGSLAISYTFH